MVDRNRLVWSVGMGCIFGLTAGAQQLDTIVYISDTLGGLSSPSKVLANPLTGRVYVASHGELLVFDPETMTKERRLPACEDMVFCGPRERIYLTGEDSLTVIDARADTATKTIPLPLSPSRLFHSPVSDRLFMPVVYGLFGMVMSFDLRGDSLLNVVTLDTMEVMKTVWDSLHDQLLIASWVLTDTEVNQVVAYDCAGDSVVARALLPWEVTSVAVNPGGRKLYCAGHSDSLLLVDTDSLRVAGSVAGAFRHSQLLYNPVRNRLYCTGPDDSVTVLDCGNDSIRARTWTGLPVSLAPNPLNGNVYVATDRENGIAVLDEADTVAGRIQTAQYGEPSVMGFSAGRSELYCPMSNDTVIVVDAGPDTVRGFIDYMSYGIRGLAHYPAGNKLYVLLPRQGIVMVLGPRYQELARISIGLNGADMPPVLNPALGRLYIGDDNLLEVVDCLGDTVVARQLMPGIAEALPLLLPELGKLYLFPAAWVDSADALVYDCLRDSMLLSLPVPGEVGGAAYHPWTHRIYAACRGPDSLEIIAIDASSDSVVSRLVLGRRTRDVSMLANDGDGRLYVANNRVDSLFVVDVRTESVVRRLSFDRDVDAVFLHRRLRKLYLCHESGTSGEVYVYDCAADTFIKTLRVNFRYAGLMNEPTDRLYLGTSGGIQVLDCRYDSVVVTLPEVTSARYAIASLTDARLFFSRRTNWFAVYRDLLGLEEGQGTEPALSFRVLGNPARGRVRFRCQVPAGQKAEFAVYDIAGRLARRSWIAGRSGTQVFAWDGCDKEGRRVAAGVYFGRLECRGRTETVKVVLE